MRKPPDETWESWVDRQIREAQERGEFDNLRGAGKPLRDLHHPYDELWWIRRKLREEGVSYVPPSLQIRKEVEEARARIGRARSEPTVRAIVREINERIREANRTVLQGPASATTPLDEEQVVGAWRAGRTTS